MIITSGFLYLTSVILVNEDDDDDDDTKLNSNCFFLKKIISTI